MSEKESNIDRMERAMASAHGKPPAVVVAKPIFRKPA